MQPTIRKYISMYAHPPTTHPPTHGPTHHQPTVAAGTLPVDSESIRADARYDTGPGATRARTTPPVRHPLGPLGAVQPGLHGPGKSPFSARGQDSELPGPLACMAGG